MAYTSPSTINASEGITEIISYINDVTYGWISNMICIAIFSIIFMGYLKANNNDYIGAFAVASYVTFVLSTLLWIMSFLNGFTYVIVIGATLIATAVLLLNKQ